MIVNHIALDGSVVRFAAPFDLSIAPVSLMFVRTRSWRCEFTAGIRELGREGATLARVDLSEEYGLQGGRLLIGRSEVIGADGSVAPHVVGVWEGRTASTITHHFRTDDSLEIIRLFSALEIIEAASDALVLRPQASSGLSVVEPPTLAKTIRGVGICHVFPVTPQSRRMIPSWAGTPVEGGELFRGRAPQGDFFVLAGPEAITTVSPEAGSDLDAVTSRLATLRINRRPAGGG